MTIKKILFFETYSILQIIFLFRYIKRAQTIYFHRRALPIIAHNLHIKKATLTLIGLINKNIKIKSPPAEMVNEYSWLMNRLAVDVVEASTDEINKSPIYRTILEIIHDDKIIKYYKAQLVKHLSARMLFFKIAKELIKKDKNQIFLVPAYNDNEKMQEDLFGKETLKPHFLSGVFLANKIRIFFNSIFQKIIFLLFPLIYIISNFKNLKLGRIKKKKYDIAVPVVYGFYNGEIIIDGVKRIEDDGYLYNTSITPGRIIHIFKHWKYPIEVEQYYKNAMDNKGIHYIDSKDFKINVIFLLIAIKLQLKILKHALSKLLLHQNRYEYLKYSNGIIKSMLKKHHEFENINFKVELIWHDYEPSHIVETILCNHQNKKTVGIQHGSTAGPYVFPHLCYDHLDIYCIRSHRHLELHSPFWNRLNVKKVGNYRIDYLTNIARSQLLITSIKNKIASMYGEKKFIVLILLPGPSEYNLMASWNEMYEALCELKSENIECNIFLRFRSVDHLEKTHIRRFKKLPDIDNRYIIDLMNFSTYELMAVSDLVISSSHSSGVIEAVSIKKKTFSFDYMRTAKHSFGKYGKDIILSLKEDVIKAVKNLENNYDGYECDWDLLRTEYNYHYDGKSLNRIRSAIWEILQKDN